MLTIIGILIVVAAVVGFIFLARSGQKAINSGAVTPSRTDAGASQPPQPPTSTKG